MISGSVAVLSDGIDSLEDFIASGIALASVRYGAKPPDAGHPYGHGGAETIAATIQAMLIGGGGIFILYNSVRRIAQPARVNRYGPRHHRDAGRRHCELCAGAVHEARREANELSRHRGPKRGT